MADYAIGDIQGCYDALMRLLTAIEFNPSQDRLWFVGDLVNRGPDSLAVLRFIKTLPIMPIITLGNHDLHLLSQIFTPPKVHHQKKDDTLDAILNAPDALELGHWLRSQFILYHDKQLNIVMCHAGIAPIWNLKQAKMYAKMLEHALRSHDFRTFLQHMYGNSPNIFTPNMAKIDKLRLICNYFTRMRCCDENGRLDLTYKGTRDYIPKHIYPWFALKNRRPIPAAIVFGHWAALKGQCSTPNIHAIDTGCLWGGQLTALRLQDMQRFTVPGRVV